MKEGLIKQQLEEKKAVIKFLEEGLGSEQQIKLSFRQVRTLLFSLDEGSRTRVIITEGANFLDGMKFALGLITAQEIRDNTLSNMIESNIKKPKIISEKTEISK